MKILQFTDIHFGKKRNSLIHNQDCIDFIGWALDQAKKHDIRHIAFLGDWHETRTEINSKTLNFSQRGLEMLNDCGWVDHIYFIVGNHDLANRNNREFTSLPHTRPLSKIELINEPTLHGDMLFLPFLFRNEYDTALKECKAKYVFGHLEFTGFLMTGEHKMKNGPEARYYSNPTYIFTGHFHKRQAAGNVIYIGNAFPMDFGDVGDTQRGICILDTDTEEVTFIDWPDCPSYTACLLSQLLDDPASQLHPKGSVECTIDVDMTYLEALELRKHLMIEYDLRLLSMHDPVEDAQELAIECGDDSDDPTDLSSVTVSNMDGLVLSMFDEVDADGIDNEKIKTMYRNCDAA